MKRLLFFLMFSLPCFATTSVTINFKDYAGTSLTPGGNYATFQVQGCGLNPTVVNGTAVMPTIPIRYDPNNSGTFTGTFYSNDVNLSCSGVSGHPTQYIVVIYINSTAVWQANYLFANGTSVDLSTLTPNSVTPVIPSPTGDNTYLRLDFGNGPVTGAGTFSNTVTFSGSLAVSGNVSSALIPNANNSLNIGSSSAAWATIFARNLTSDSPQSSGGGKDFNLAATNGLTAGGGGTINLTAGNGVGGSNGGGIIIKPGTGTAAGKVSIVDPPSNHSIFFVTSLSTSDRNLTIPNADSVTVQPFGASAHNFLTSLSSGGLLAAAQPAASDLSNGTTGSGSVVLSAGPTLTGTTAVGNLTVNNTPSSVWGLDQAQTNNKVTIANNGTYDLAAGSGLVIIHSDTSGNICLFLSAAGATTLISDPGGVCSVTAATAAKTNFFFNGSTAYRIENKTGGSVNYYITTIKTRSAT